MTARAATVSRYLGKANLPRGRWLPGGGPGRGRYATPGRWAPGLVTEQRGATAIVRRVFAFGLTEEARRRTVDRDLTDATRVLTGQGFKVERVDEHLVVSYP